MRCLIPFLLLLPALVLGQQTAPTVVSNAAASQWYSLAMKDLEVAEAYLLSTIAIQSPSPVVLSNAAAAQWYALSSMDLQVAQSYLLSVIAANGTGSGALTFDSNQFITNSAGVHIKSSAALTNVTIYSASPSATVFINSLNRALIDPSGNVSVDGGNRYLKDSTGNLSINWQTGEIFDSSGNTSILFYGHQLYGAEGNLAADWTARVVYDSDGNPAFDWSTGSVVFNSSISSPGEINTLEPSTAGHSIVFPNTTVNFTNTTGVNIVLYINNTGVTGTAIKQNGTTVGPVLASSITTLILSPGGYFSETYTIGTPSAVYFFR